MTRVHHVKKARKDNPAVKKGEAYFWWKFAYAPKRYSKTRPRASQLTLSEKMARYYEAQETIEDLDTQGEIDTVIEALQGVGEEVQEIANEYQESADNIRDAFTESPTADECDEKVFACEETVACIEDAVSTLQDLDLEPDDIGTVQGVIDDIPWDL